MQTRMRSSLMMLSFLAPAFTPALHAQYASHPRYSYNQPTLPAFQITPFAGYMDFGHYVNGPLGSNVPYSNGPIVGGQASLALTKNVGVYGELGYANSNNGVSYVNPYNGFVHSNSNGMWIYDGGLQLMAPFKAEDRHWVVPFVQIGAGAITYRLSDGFNTNTDTRFAWNGGVGFDYHFTRQVGLRLMVKDYLATFNIPSTITTNGMPTIGQTTTNNNNWAFNAGLNFGF
jgi:outer membrane protein with beta-barrel domain